MVIFWFGGCVICICCCIYNMIWLSVRCLVVELLLFLYLIVWRMLLNSGFLRCLIRCG